MAEKTLTEQVGPEKSKASLFGLLAAQKSSKFKYMSRDQFSLEFDVFFFEMLVTMSSITINNN